MPGQRTANVRLEKRADGPHSCQTTSANASAATPIESDREHLDPEHRRQRVVDEAVGDERVAAGVPEVVPDREAVLEQERALVGVSRQIDAGWPEPEEHAREHGRHDGGEDPLAGEQPTFCAAHKEQPTSAYASVVAQP